MPMYKVTFQRKPGYGKKVEFLSAANEAQLMHSVRQVFAGYDLSKIKVESPTVEEENALMRSHSYPGTE
jgi:hypothetical protein